MAITVNGTNIEKINVEMVTVDGITVWTPQITVTIYEGTNVYTKKVEKGKSFTLSSATTLPSGTSLVGYSKSSTGTSPVTSFISDTDLTVYRVVKYSDRSVAVSHTERTSANSNYGNATYTLIDAQLNANDLIDCTKYDKVGIYYEINNGGGGAAYLHMSGTGLKTFGTVSMSKFNETFTIPFTSGNRAVSMYMAVSGQVYKVFQCFSITAYGKTLVK